jgi:hypothetical protein
MLPACPYSRGYGSFKNGTATFEGYGRELLGRHRWDRRPGKVDGVRKLPLPDESTDTREMPSPGIEIASTVRQETSSLPRNLRPA